MPHRAFLACGAAFVASVAAAGFLPHPASLLLAALLPGCVAGLIAESPARSAAMTLLGGGVGASVAVILNTADATVVRAFIGMAASVSPFVAVALSTMLRVRPKRVSTAIVMSALFVVLAAMWTAGLARASTNPLYPFTADAIAADIERSGLGDVHLYAMTYVLMQHNQPYYSAVVAASDQLLQRPPDAPRAGALGFRQPWLYWMWLVLERLSGVGIPIAFLIVATVGVTGAYLLVATYLRRVLGLLAAALTAAYFVNAVGWAELVSHEVWAAAFLSGALGIAARALSKPGSYAMLFAAAAFSLAAALMREQAVIGLCVALMTWLTYRPSRPKFEKVIWAATFSLYVVQLAAHFTATGRPLMTSGQGRAYTFFDLDRALAMFLPGMGTEQFSGPQPLFVALIVVGTFAPLLLSTYDKLLVAGTVTGIMALVFSVGPMSADPRFAAPAYWAAIGQAPALACAPLVFMLSRQARRPWRSGGQPAGPAEQ